MTAHSRIGPSALHRLLACPGSYSLSASQPPGRSSFYAAEGTVAHSMVEEALGDGVLLEAPSVGDVVIEDEHQISVDQEMQDGVNEMVAFCQPIKDAASAVWVEQRVDLGCVFPGQLPEPIFGTVDFAAYHHHTETLYVVDFKYGRLPVIPQNNPQALAYALGAYTELRTTRRVTPKTVVLAIIQPRGRDGKSVKVDTITGLDLQLWRDFTFIPGINALFDPNPMVTPGTHCTFCPAKVTCPAMSALAQQKAKASFGEIPANPSTFSDEELGDVLNWADVLSQWVAQVRAEASGRIDRGRTVPNWKLVPRRAMRRWTNDMFLDAEVMDNLEDHPTFWDRKLKSPAAIEKEDPGLYATLDASEYVERNSSGSTLAPDTDPRQAVVSKAATTQFDKIEEPT